MNDQTTNVDSDSDKAARLAIVEALASVIKEQRKDAITGRAASGIEQEWQEDTDFYEGFDEYSKGRPVSLKGRTPTDGVRETSKDAGTRSTAFLKITRPYCDAAAARFSDMILPTDDRNFAFRPTPKPTMVQSPQGTPALPAPVPAQPQAPAPQLAAPQGMPPPGVPTPGAPAPQGVMGQMMAPAPAAPPPPPAPVDDSKERCEKAQVQVDDWLVESRFHAEVRKMIESAARVGTGILKGPHPGRVKKRAVQQTPEGYVMEIVEETKPQSKYVDVWNLYPDPSCGNDIQKGAYVFEADDITARGLMDLKGGGYIDEMIDLCLQEGPTNPTTGTRKNKEDQKTTEKDLYQIWYCHSFIKREDIVAAGCKCGDKEQYPVILTMVNDRIIKIALSPLDSGEYPYDVMVWQERQNHWAGVGVARQMRECQKGANAAVRNLMDNAGLSAGPQIIINRDKIRPANGKWEITPRKLWLTVTGEEVGDVSKAFQIVNIQTLQGELMAILQFWLKEAEDVTGMPMLLQGQQGKSPDTVGGMEILNNNGTTVLRRIARTFDDKVTEPHMGRYYEYLLIYGPEECKGDFTIDARGSSALVERMSQQQQLMQLIGASLNPAYGLDPELVMSEVMKSMRFDAKKMVFSDEKKQQMAQQKPPEDPRIQAAKIKVQSDKELLQMKAKVEGINLQADRVHESQENDKDRQNQMMVQMIDEKLSTAELSSVEKTVLEKIKADLAKAAATLQAQERMSVMSHRADLHKFHGQAAKPLAEPAGRADNGQAFAQ